MGDTLGTLRMLVLRTLAVAAALVVALMVWRQAREAERLPDVAPVAAGGEAVGCATRTAAPLEPRCALERGAGGALIVRHPDGHFRRLVANGSGYVAADGADAVSAVTDTGAVPAGQVAIAIGEDRYRLPALPTAPAPTQPEETDAPR